MVSSSFWVDYVQCSFFFCLDFVRAEKEREEREKREERREERKKEKIEIRKKKREREKKGKKLQLDIHKYQQVLLWHQHKQEQALYHPLTDVLD